VHLNQLVSGQKKMRMEKAHGTNLPCWDNMSVPSIQYGFAKLCNRLTCKSVSKQCLFHVLTSDTYSNFKEFRNSWQPADWHAYNNISHLMSTIPRLPKHQVPKHSKPLLQTYKKQMIYIRDHLKKLLYFESLHNWLTVIWQLNGWIGIKPLSHSDIFTVLKPLCPLPSFKKDVKGRMFQFHTANTDASLKLKLYVTNAQYLPTSGRHNTFPRWFFWLNVVLCVLLAPKN
jgi:hypothetical protein